LRLDAFDFRASSTRRSIRRHRPQVTPASWWVTRGAASAALALIAPQIGRLSSPERWTLSRHRGFGADSGAGIPA
jgi:hypothetical protein